MGLFSRRTTTPEPLAPVIALTDTDIDQITASVRRASKDATIEVLHGTIQVRDLMANAISRRLATSGYEVRRPDPYACTVLGWRPTPGQALSVAEADERIDLLMKMRQQADAANHLTRKATA